MLCRLICRQNSLRISNRAHSARVMRADCCSASQRVPFFISFLDWKNMFFFVQKRRPQPCLVDEVVFRWGHTWTRTRAGNTRHGQPHRPSPFGRCNLSQTLCRPLRSPLRSSTILQFGVPSRPPPPASLRQATLRLKKLYMFPVFRNLHGNPCDWLKKKKKKTPNATPPFSADGAVRLAQTTVLATRNEKKQTIEEGWWQRGDNLLVSPTSVPSSLLPQVGSTSSRKQKLDGPHHQHGRSTGGANSSPQIRILPFPSPPLSSCLCAPWH